MYKQGKSNLYIPFRIPIPMAGYDLSVKYLEKLDETCVEFVHAHSDYEIYYMLEDRLRITVEGEEHVLLPNNFLLIPPGVRHGAIYEPGVSKRYAVLVYSIHTYSEARERRKTAEQDFMERLNKALLSASFIIERDNNNCCDILSEIQREVAGKEAGWQIMLSDKCREFFVKLIRNVLNDGQEPEPEAGQSNLAIEITKYMHEHYNENISLNDIANAFHITARHATRIFSEYFDTGFRRTLSIYRLNYAKNYLCDTDKSIEEIATLVGLGSPQTLYRLFKEFEGMTVSEYRKMHRKLG